MKPVRFAGVNVVLTRPEGMGEKDCGDLPICRTVGGHCISCWTGSWVDRLRFLVTGRMWLWVWSGSTQPPVCLATEDPGMVTIPDPSDN